jgi:hypothetical protein
VEGTEHRSAESALPKEEFLDAVQRHICQVLGFDYGFIDLVMTSITLLPSLPMTPVLMPKNRWPLCVTKTSNHYWWQIRS